VDGMGLAVVSDMGDLLRRAQGTGLRAQ